MSRGHGKNEKPVYNWGIVNQRTGKVLGRFWDTRREAQAWRARNLELNSLDDWKVERISVRVVKNTRDLNLLA